MQHYMIQITEKLERKGYRQLNPDISNVYGRAEGDIVYVVVIGYDRGLTAEKLRTLDMSISDKIAADVRILHVIVTPTGMFEESTMELVRSVRNTWLVTEDYGKLYVFEDQPQDFDGLYAVLDSGFAQPGNRSGRKLADAFGIVTPILILLNVLVYVAGLIADRGSSEYVFEYELAVNARAVIYEKQYYRLLTSVFTHFGFAHLFANMVMLAALGSRLENILGKARYLTAYIIMGLVSSVASLLSSYYGMDEYVYSAGASGAIMGLLGIMTAIAATHKGHVGDLSLHNMVILFILTILNGVFSEGIDNIAHVSGFAAGLIIGIVLMLTNQKVVNNRHL